MKDQSEKKWASGINASRERSGRDKAVCIEREKERDNAPSTDHAEGSGTGGLVEGDYTGRIWYVYRNTSLTRVSEVAWKTCQTGGMGMMTVVCLVTKLNGILAAVCPAAQRREAIQNWPLRKPIENIRNEPAARYSLKAKESNLAVGWSKGTFMSWYHKSRSLFQHYGLRQRDLNLFHSRPKDCPNTSAILLRLHLTLVCKGAWNELVSSANESFWRWQDVLGFEVKSGLRSVISGVSLRNLTSKSRRWRKGSCWCSGTWYDH